MKALILSCCGAVAFLSFSACEAERRHDHDRGAQTTTTSTEETSAIQPVGASTQTQTVRTN